MINELHQLSLALDEAKIGIESWYRKYKEIPNITTKAPCVRILLSGNQVACLESIDATLGRHLRKYGDNMGTFPAMNLAPLYKIHDEDAQKEISALLKKFTDGDVEKLDIPKIRAWCQHNNWESKKFKQNYSVSINDRTIELEQLFSDSVKYTPILRLIQTVRKFAEPQTLHEVLEKKVFELLEKGMDSLLVLQVLFDTDKKDNYKRLSVIFDDADLEDSVQSCTVGFTIGFNEALIKSDSGKLRPNNKKAQSKSKEKKDSEDMP